jgi:general secretion pathway protein I
MTMTMTMTCHRESKAGFSLLEVMISMAILSLSLMALIEITTNNVAATHHAKMTTAATFLARTRIADLEDQVLELGFGDNEIEDEGDFTEQGYPGFRWHTLVERVELPTDIAQQTQAEAGEMTQTTNPMQAMTGMLGGFMSTLIDPIRIGLQESVRRVTVNVSWEEFGRRKNNLDVVLFMTDPARLDMAMQAPASPAGGTTPTQGASGTGAPGTSRSPGQRTNPVVPR